MWDADSPSLVGSFLDYDTREAIAIAESINDFETREAIAIAESIASHNTLIKRHATNQFNKAHEFIQSDAKMESVDDSHQVLDTRVERRGTFWHWCKVIDDLEASNFELVDEAMVNVSLVILEYIYLKPSIKLLLRHFYYPQLTQRILMKKVEFKIITSSILFWVYPEDAEKRREYKEIIKYARYDMDHVQMESQTKQEKVDNYNSLHVAYQLSILPSPTSETPKYWTV